MEKINSNSPERIQEIENFITQYFRKYKVGFEASGIGCTQGTELASSFWGYLHDGFSKDIKDILYENLSEKTLIDLGVGCNGNNIPGYMDVPFRKYVGVDIDQPYANALYAIEDMRKRGVDASLVDSDMLKYLISLPDDSANFFLSAIDSDVILSDEYWKYLCEEIYRCTENNGILIDAGVGHIDYYLEKMIPGKFKKIYDVENSHWGKKIFQKV